MPPPPPPITLAEDYADWIAKAEGPSRALRKEGNRSQDCRGYYKGSASVQALAGSVVNGCFIWHITARPVSCATNQAKDPVLHNGA